MHPVFAWAFNVLVLYLTMGFRQFSHYFTDIHLALRAGRLEEARSLLSRWQDIPSHELNAEEVARLTIEQALIASHRNVFGVIVWFMLFSGLGLGGAAGALLYRLGGFLRTHWGAEDSRLGLGPLLRESASVPRFGNRLAAPVTCHGSGENRSESGEFGELPCRRAMCWNGCRSA